MLNLFLPGFKRAILKSLKALLILFPDLQHFNISYSCQLNFLIYFIKNQQNKLKCVDLKGKTLDQIRFHTMNKGKQHYSGFYSSTFVYSHSSSKIQFLYCSLSSVATWGGPTVDTDGEFLKLRYVDCWKMHFSWIFLGIFKFHGKF